jgi:hypothetical protein
MDLVRVTNKTKWDEIRLAMYELADLSPRWRTRCVENGFVTAWDSEWFYHFRDGGYEITEWVEIEVTSSEQKTAVHNVLSKIHVPGEFLDNIFRVYGHVPVGQPIDYL